MAFILVVCKKGKPNNNIVLRSPLLFFIHGVDIDHTIYWFAPITLYNFSISIFIFIKNVHLFL